MISSNTISARGSRQFTLQPEKEWQLTQMFLERATDAVFWFDLDARCIYANPVACHLTGYSREELLTMRISDINPNLSRIWSERWSAIEQANSLTFESLHRTKAGWHFPVEVTLTYLACQGREYTSLSLRDITQRKQLEVALQRANDTLAKLEQQGLIPKDTRELPPTVSDNLPSSRSIFPANPKLSQVFSFIESNYHRSITLSDVARAVGYSSAYLTDLVRRQTGKTVNHWIVERRLTEACALLRETDRTANEIAETVGYQNPGHFFRQFRQHCGTTPQAWRKLHQFSTV